MKLKKFIQKCGPFPFISKNGQQIENLVNIPLGLQLLFSQSRGCLPIHQTLFGGIIDDNLFHASHRLPSGIEPITLLLGGPNKDWVEAALTAGFGGSRN